MTEPIDVYLGKRLRERRRMLGLTQLRLADAVGIRFQQIQKYESGQNRMSASRLWQFAVCMEVEIGFFFEGYRPNTDWVDLTSDHSGRPPPDVKRAARKPT